MDKIKKFLPIGLINVLALPFAWASEPLQAEKFVPFHCEAIHSLEERIDACTSNTKAVESARSCYQRILNAWKQAPEDLNRILSIASKRDETRQQAELNFSRGDYEKSIARLKHLIEVTEINTRLVADYPLAMLHDPDFPELGCYKKPFNQVQEIVFQLDDRLAEGKRSLAAAETLRDVSGDRLTKIEADSLIQQLPQHSYGAGSARAPAQLVRGSSPRTFSDITGTERSRQKEILTNFKLRDQLLGP